MGRGLLSALVSGEAVLVRVLCLTLQFGIHLARDWVRTQRPAEEQDVGLRTM